MSKRSAFELDLKEDDRADDPSLNLRKKIKIEHNYIISRAKRVNEELDLSDHKVNKFLLIFHTLIDTIDFETEPEETDGIVTDIILQIVLKFSSLIRQNIELLPLPQVLKDALKVIKQLLNAKTMSQSSRGATMEEELKERPSLPSSSSSSTSTTSSSSSSTPTTSSSTPTPTSTSPNTP